MTLDTEVQSLRQIPMFKGIEPSRLKLLAFTAERIHFKAGQPFFTQGDAADAAYVILDGRAEVILDKRGTRIKVAEVGRNDLVGEMAILADVPRTASVVAVEALSALRIDKRVFLELLTQFPLMSIAVMRELAGRLERTNAQLVAQASGVPD